MRHLADVLFAASMLGAFTMGALRPVVIARWLKSADPEIREDDPRVLWIVRVVGIGGLVISVFMSLIIVRSFTNQ